MTFSLPDLEYDYGALEPHIDARTMEIHHSKHHQGYVDKANKALEGTEWADKSPCEILTQLEKLPENIRTAAKNNVGGHCNHWFFWTTIGPNAGGEPVGDLASVINKSFGDFNSFKEDFKKEALGRFGSGWAWLVVKNGKLEIISTPNQDSPLTLLGKDTRVIGLDVWEHAYYLKYQNRRPEYVDAFWNVVRWDRAEENYQKALQK
ncbi:superoxide dismutase [Candidatus Gracilibacteria bacterium]|nr:superoxide dismutase [Candidatus Gracilibacteria bacterium]MCF7819174.1 superoxide dismutase [Candidatus Gracilibacteria bacterium]